MDKSRQVSGDQYAELQKNFAEAYDRKDVDAMASAFTEDAIRRNLQDVVNLDLHDYSVERNVSRSIGSFVFNGGEWRAMLGDKPLRGYYTAIMSETAIEPRSWKRR